MIERTAKCDVCKTSINLGAGYALLPITNGYGTTFKIKAGVGEYEVATAHLCGKECLIRKMSEEIDRITTKPADAGKTDTDVRHGSLPLIRMEGRNHGSVSGH